MKEKVRRLVMAMIYVVPALALIGGVRNLVLPSTALADGYYYCCGGGYSCPNGYNCIDLGSSCDPSRGADEWCSYLV